MLDRGGAIGRMREMLVAKGMARTSVRWTSGYAHPEEAVMRIACTRWIAGAAVAAALALVAGGPPSTRGLGHYQSTLAHA